MATRRPAATPPDLWRAIREQLEAQGVDLDSLCADAAGEGAAVKVVAIAAGLNDSVVELGKSPRDQVVMVRVDEGTSDELDAWVETGAVKSRSEAAALFIREGLKVRAAELAQLRDALRAVDVAKRKLREKAREVFGPSDPSARSSAAHRDSSED